MNAETKILPDQLAKLDALIAAAYAARAEARKGDLFVSVQGLALTNAAFDLFECDGLYDIAGDVRHELGIDEEGFPTGDDGERVYDRESPVAIVKMGRAA